MGWIVRLTDSAADDLSKLDTQTRNRIWRFLRRWIVEADNPRERGAALTDDLSGMWKYRIGDYRLLCEIQDSALVVLIVKAGHRSKIYRRK